MVERHASFNRFPEEAAAKGSYLPTRGNSSLRRDARAWPTRTPPEAAANDIRKKKTYRRQRPLGSG
jgi:hypothetical protein